MSYGCCSAFMTYLFSQDCISYQYNFGNGKYKQGTKLLKPIRKQTFNSYFSVLGTRYYNSASHGTERYQTLLQEVSAVALVIDVGALAKEPDVGALILANNQLDTIFHVQ